MRATDASATAQEEPAPEADEAPSRTETPGAAGSPIVRTVHHRPETGTRVTDESDMASGLDALETPTAAGAKAVYRRLLSKAGPPVVAIAFVLVLWQLAYGFGWSSTLPSPGAVWGHLADDWADGTLLPAIGHSLLRCLIGFGASAVIGIPLGVLLTRLRPVRTVLGPILSSLQSLPAAGLVPIAVIALGNSEQAVYAVVLLGAVPSIAVSVAAGIDQVPPLLLRAGTSMGATGLRGALLVLVPAALPSFIAALRQGWTFGWRALMTAELITATPLPGIGRMLSAGKEAQSMSLVLASVLLILAVGVLVESALFSPLERRVLHSRGLAGSRR
jgi:NitT/TauT family transport system permease protein